MDLWNLIQWPAMAVNLWGSWLMTSSRDTKRHAGFWWFILSNGLWGVWGLHDGAYALVALQVGLATLNIRGVCKTTT